MDTFRNECGRSDDAVLVAARLPVELDLWTPRTSGSA
jgi:hypothetical protein